MTNNKKNKEKQENYNNIDIPEDKDPKDYTYLERRAELLKLILNAGHPRAINQTQICKRYGVSRSQISHDIKALGEHLGKQSKEDIELITEAIYQKGIRELQKKGKHYKAIKAVNLWNEWLFNTGKIEKEPNKVEDVTKDKKLEIEIIDNEDKDNEGIQEDGEGS